MWEYIVNCVHLLQAAEVSPITGSASPEGTCMLFAIDGRHLQVWVFVNKPRKCVVVAFRGTEQVKWRDFLTDVRVNPTAFNTERVHVSHRPKLDVGAVVRPLTRP